MMQKVRGEISAFLGLTGLFHFSFSVPLRYFLYRSIVPFLSPILRGKNGLVWGGGGVLGGINIGVLFLWGGLAGWRQGNPTCTDNFSV